MILIVVWLVCSVVLGGPDLQAADQHGPGRPRTSGARLEAGPELPLPKSLTAVAKWRLPSGFGGYGAAADENTAVIPAGPSGLLWVARDSGINGLRSPTDVGREIVAAIPLARGWILLETEPLGTAHSRPGVGRTCESQPCWRWHLSWVSSPMPGSVLIPIASSRAPVSWFGLPAVRSAGVGAEWLEPGRARVAKWSPGETPGRQVQYRAPVSADHRWQDRLPDWITLTADSGERRLRATGHRVPGIQGAVRRVLAIGTDDAYVRTDDRRFLVTARGRATFGLPERLIVGAAPGGITVVGSDAGGNYVAVICERNRSPSPQPHNGRSIAWG